MASKLDRRAFLKVGAAAGGGMLLGFSLFGCKGSGTGDTSGAPGMAGAAAGAATEVVTQELNAWVRIATDGTVTLLVPKSEMGQGVLTSLPMILAEELDLDWTRVRSEHAPTNEALYGLQITGGSMSVRFSFESLRKVGAAAREMLVAAAAQSWGVDPGECRTELGRVIHEGSGRQAGYGELAGAAATLAAPEAPRLKDRKDFRIIGKPIKRLDTPAKVRGETIFGIDVQRPGLRVAQVAHSPVIGGTVKSFDASKAEAVPGVRAVIEIPTGVAVVADHFWAAQKGREALEIEWDEGANASLSSASITETLRRSVSQGREARKDGDAVGATRRARRKLEAVYEVPFLAHASMEPMNCTVEVRPDGCELWVPTQAPTRAAQAAAEITGLPADKIVVHTTMMGGGFGRRSLDDFVIEALHIGKAAGGPIKLVWTREDDTRGGGYRPVGYNQMAGSLDADGWPDAWVHRIACPSIVKSPAGKIIPLRLNPDDLDFTSIEGAANLPYAIPNLLVTCAEPVIPVSIWMWRSVGNSQNGYVTECFFDELAALGGKDPVEARLRLLGEHPRHRRVLELAADKAGWGSALPEGMARGVALHASFGSIVAQVAEVSIEAQGAARAVKVHRVVCAVDCGEVVNPNTIEAQMESGILYGLSAALHGKIDIDKGRVVQGNFHDYPVVRMKDTPRIETYIVAEGDQMGGIGEPGTPPAAPAVCNALRALTGTPVRKLPIQLA
jgi:isoquinoline 1-oxidoreductase subunit beta